MVPEAVTLQQDEVLSETSEFNSEKRRETAGKEAAKEQKERALQK